MNRTKELTVRTETVEKAVEEVTGKTTPHSMEINNMKHGLKEEVEKLRAEVKRRPRAIMMCAAKVEDREKISFKGNK